MTKECRNCRQVMTEKVGDFEHVAFDNPVTLCGVPYWKCESCGHQFYKDAKKVEETIVEALIKKQRSVDYH